MDRGAGGLILPGALLAALLLIVAEFTSLYQVHVATSSVPIKTVTGGHNHSYAMLIIGLVAAGLAVLVWRSGSRTALLALGVLGLVALLIAVFGDLPDSHATGLAGNPIRGYVNASSTPSAGLYMETLGAILLIATCGLGFFLLGSALPRPRPERPSEGPRSRPPAEDGPAGNGDGVGNGKGSPQAWSRGRRGDSEPPA